jgi:sugar-specific transcriptional regulator TrmB
MKERATKLLEDVGFSGLESEVYLALLKEPCATGYRVAQLIGKPAPNTYKALDSLRTKGVVVMDDTARTRTYSALPIGVYLEARTRELEEKQRELEREVADLETSTPEGGIFRLTSVEQVYTRARAMLDGAKRAVLLDVFPGPMEKLRPDIARAVKRGVNVFIKAYRPVAVKGADVVCPEKDDAPDLKLWNGDWLNITVDCCESLYSFLKPDGRRLHDAVWSRNQYVGMMNFNGLLHELLLTRVLNLLRQNKTREEIAPELRELGKRYLALALWRDAVPEGWFKEWPEEDGTKKKDKPAARRSGKRRVKKNREES